MPWIWELRSWPKFQYDVSRIAQMERQFLLGAGGASASLKSIGTEEFQRFMVEILSLEGLNSSKIEGEFLDRESLQSSIRKKFGLVATMKKGAERETRMAKLLLDVYETFAEPLSHKMLWQWYSILFSTDGAYRSHAEPMQIVSNKYGSEKVYFEAPPSDAIPKEMDIFIDWFNNASTSLSILGRAAVAHVYFECIHPFEDGNGRIGRLLVEKILSQSIGKPVLIAVSKVLEKEKKKYYAELEKCNRTLNIQEWIEFFASAILQAQEESMSLLYFLIEKSKMLTALAKRLNSRQEKVLLRMFEEGPSGFKGGLSAENYISITKTSRATATRDLAALVEMGALVKTGELRHTRYWLNFIKLINNDPAR